MRRAPTPEEFTRIMAVMERVQATPQQVSWNGTKPEGRALCKAISGYKPSKGDCLACELTVVNILREAVNLPPVGGVVHDHTYLERIAICNSCPDYVHTTRSCGPLIFGALKEGTCGCFIPIKARIKQTQCPQGKW